MNTIQISRFHELEDIIEKGLRTFIDVGRCFVEIKESGLYKEKYKTFADYCDQRWGFSLNYAEKLMRTVRTEETLKTGTRVPLVLPANEAESRALEALSDDDKRTVWDKAVETAPGGKMTAPHIRATRESLFPRADKSETMQKGVLIKCPECGHEWFIDS
jgi:hypothetical protein